MADRVAIINQGKILLVEEKEQLMKRLGKKELIVELQDPIAAIPDNLTDRDLILSEDGLKLTYSYDAKQEKTGITALLSDISDAGLRLKDLQTHTSSLEEIFVSLVNEGSAS